jgi:hypothetical protein
MGGVTDLRELPFMSKANRRWLLDEEPRVQTQTYSCDTYLWKKWQLLLVKNTLDKKKVFILISHFICNLYGYIQQML